MDDRTVIEWDKDDLDTLEILKVDVLGLGMLSCLRRGFDLVARHYGVEHTLASIPEEEPAVYNMLSRADSIGVFQVESRAQMSMLPRLRPKEFYDLVIEVAIVRPGPIQGDMVHPYLRRKEGLEPVDIPSPDPEFGDKNELKKVLDRTLGVPLFQEQAMQIAMVAAGFTADEASKLRRSMATFRRTGEVKLFRKRFIEGMCERGYPQKVRRELLQADRRLRRIRLSREPRRELCASGLCVGVDQMPLPRRVSDGVAQQPTDGFLRDVATCS